MSFELDREKEYLEDVYHETTGGDVLAKRTRHLGNHAGFEESRDWCS